jgi:hypothetical protein
MFTKIQDQATIRRPDFEKLYHESKARVDIKRKVIKHQKERIIVLKEKLTEGDSANKTCTHTVKSK